jgi:beta-lactamase class A
MKLFGKKDEDEEEKDEEEELEEKIHSKKFKDLTSENRKKRKEPPKPWGKKERLIVLSTLLITVLIAGGLALSSRDFKLPGLPRIHLPSLSFQGETIIIEGNKEGKEKAERVKKAFSEKTNNYSGVYALYVVRLGDGYSYGINENSTMQAASLIKLPVLMTLYKEAEAGRIDLETKYTLKNSDKRPGSGSLASKPAGTVLTYRDLARLMGKQSDNTAFNIIRNVLGEEKINAEIKSLGMSKTNLTENETSPKDIGTLFEKLWKLEIVSQKSRDEILEYLTGTIYENWLVAGIPADVRVAHKYGRELHVVNDAGIVYAPKPFVLVIMSDGVVEREADELIPDLTRIIYNIEVE